MIPLHLVAVSALLAAPPEVASPTAGGAVLSPLAQWHAVEACPRVVGTGGTATAVVVGHKDGFTYLLTAKHALDEVGEPQLDFFTWPTYPQIDWTPKRDAGYATTIAVRSAVADFALLKITLPKRQGEVADLPIPRLRLAAPGDRPKAFPFDAISVGCSGGHPPTCEAVVVRDKRFARRDTSAGAFFWEAETAPTRGRSGGPLISKDGRVIGLCAANKDGRGYYTHLDEIHAELKGKGFAWLWEDGPADR